MCNGNFGVKVWGMGMDNIKELIRDLDWSKPEEVQKKSIEQLLKMHDSELIFLAQQNELCHKYCWHNAAAILKAIGYPRIRPVIPYLMEWFQDINWPGVVTIVETLRTINPNELIPYIEEASKRSIDENDDCWAFGLVTLIRELDLTPIVNKDIYNELIWLSNY